MASQGYTKSPCPSCHKACDGQDGRQYQRRSDSLCDDCKKIMQYGRDYLAEKERLKNEDNAVVVGVPNSRPSLHFGSRTHYGWTELELLGNLIFELINLVSEEVPKDYYKYSECNLAHFGNVYKSEFSIIEKNDSRQTPTNRFFKNKRVAELLDELYTEMKKQLKQVEDSGVEYGKNIMFQLNDGTISLKEFNK